MWPKWLTDALSGKVSLGRAFWLYGVGVSIGYSAVAAFIDLTRPVAIAIYVVFGLVVGLVQTVILWRSAKNSPSKILGRLVRILVIVGLLLTLVMVYLLYAGSAALLPADLR
jgi:phage-related minor tail protein